MLCHIRGLINNITIIVHAIYIFYSSSLTLTLASSCSRDMCPQRAALLSNCQALMVLYPSSIRLGWSALRCRPPGNLHGCAAACKIPLLCHGSWFSFRSACSMAWTHLASDFESVRVCVGDSSTSLAVLGAQSPVWSSFASVSIVGVISRL